MNDETKANLIAAKLCGKYCKSCECTGVEDNPTAGEWNPHCGEYESSDQDCIDCGGRSVMSIHTNKADAYDAVVALTVEHSIVISYWKKQEKFRYRRVWGDPSGLFDTFLEALQAALIAIGVES